jgi:glycosyltransferase involved in cell wall biosynthesis
MKKIAFLINSLGMGGAEKVLLTYVNSLVSEYGYSVSVITNENSEECYICQEIKKHATYYYLVDNSSERFYFFKKIHRSIKRKHKLRYLLSDCDVVIDFLDADFHKYLRGINKRKITWLHSSFFNLETRKSRIRAKCNDYDDIIMICHDMFAELDDFDILWKKKVSVIYNPFDFHAIEMASSDSSGLTIIENEYLSYDFILSVSRLDEQTKDILGLIKAYSIAKKNGLSKKLFIIGDGVDRVNLEKEVAILKLDGDILFLGQQSNPYIWMRHASSFVLSSKGEGFALVLVEALLLTGSVISTDCPVGPSEILDKGKLGALFPIGDYNELARLLNSPPSRIETVDLAKYSKESVLSKLIAILER